MQPTITATGPVITGPADFTPLEVAHAVTSVAAELNLGRCFICRRPLLPNYISIRVVQSEAGFYGYFARAHRSCWDARPHSEN